MLATNEHWPQKDNLTESSKYQRLCTTEDDFPMLIMVITWKLT